MGWFSRNSTAAIDWTHLTEIEKLDRLIEQSVHVPVLLFKHSTRCSISSMAMNRLESEWDLTKEEIIPVYLDLIAYRSISNEIADRFGVTHQSPQVLLIKDGICTYDTSHNQISVRDLKQNL
jgi:bacillithiol system protein YtxJ